MTFERGDGALFPVPGPGGLIDFTEIFAHKVRTIAAISHSLDHHFRRNHTGPPRNNGFVDFSQRFTPASALFSSASSSTARVRGQNSSTASNEIAQKSTTFRSPLGEEDTHSLSLHLNSRVGTLKILSHFYERARDARHLLRKCTIKQATFTHSENLFLVFPFRIAVRSDSVRLTKRHFFYAVSVFLFLSPSLMGQGGRSRTNVFKTYMVQSGNGTRWL